MNDSPTSNTESGQNKIWVVVPQFNEAQNIEMVLKELCQCNFCNCNLNIVAIDDCSTDGTYKISSSFPIVTGRHLLNLGQGAALQTGITYALSQGAEYIVTFDADGQHQVSDIPKLLQPLQQGRADVALGSRFLAGGVAEGIPGMRRLLLRMATIYTKVTTGLKITDTHNGLRAFTAKAAAKIKITQNRMAHASEILSCIAEQKLSIVEVPVHIKYSAQSLKKGQKASNSFNILWESITGILRR